MEKGLANGWEVCQLFKANTLLFSVCVRGNYSVCVWGSEAMNRLLYLTFLKLIF